VPAITHQRREELQRRVASLRSERSTWLPQYMELSKFIMPRNGRFMIADHNRGTRRHNNILDNTGTRALRTLSAGMMSGMTSPARPWFRLETSDPELNKSAAVKVWLSDVTRLLLRIFSKSNTYRALHSTYEELGVFGTSAKVIADDFKHVIHHTSLTAGEYMIATDYLGNVDTLAREFEMTVGQMVREYGITEVSATVKALYDRNALDAWIPVTHVIQPRTERDRASPLAKDMAWESVCFEQGRSEYKVLRDSGYKEFPAAVSRWAVSGGDIYGGSPGQESLGDIKQLQQQQLRKGQAIDYQTKPPLQAPSSMKNQESDMLPGGVTYYDGTTPGAGIRTAFDVTLNLQHLLLDIQDVRERVKSSFYADLWLMLQQVDAGRMTATEVAERKEEKLLMLGPTTERLHFEELQPLVEGTFARALRAGIVPPAPEEMQGQDLNVNFISTLAQAQRAIATNSIDRFVGNIGQIATIKPGVLDKLDEDEWADVYADALGIDPRLIVPDSKVAMIRANRAQVQQAQQQAAQANVEADTAQKMAQAQGGAIAQGAAGSLARGAGPITDATRAFSGYV
jgi:hypothetical protein